MIQDTQCWMHVKVPKNESEKKMKFKVGDKVKTNNPYHLNVKIVFDSFMSNHYFVNKQSGDFFIVTGFNHDHSLCKDKGVL